MPLTDWEIERRAHAAFRGVFTGPTIRISVQHITSDTAHRVRGVRITIRDYQDGRCRKEHAVTVPNDVFDAGNEQLAADRAMTAWVAGT